MSRRRYPVRSAAASRRPVVSSTSDSSEASDDEIDLFHELMDLYQNRNTTRSRKRKNTKSSTSSQKNKSKTTSPGRGARSRTRVARNQGSRATKSQSSTSKQIGFSGRLTSVDRESDVEIIDEVVESNHQKDIENKVNNFFKSGNLLSDDDDDLNLVNSTEQEPIKEPKKFYELSDSDDEPTKNDNSICLNTTESKPNHIEIISSNSTTNKDELMDIVDKILDCDDMPQEVDTVPDISWTDYKNKREEILGSVKALLSELEEPIKAKEQEVVQEESPEISKPSCPICWEILGGDVVAASTMCGHIFCQDCIMKVVKTTRVCPTCRKRINFKQIHPLYL